MPNQVQSQSEMLVKESVMAYSDEEQAKVKKQNSQTAIELALGGRWREAIEANKAIMELFPDDVETLNRLGRAYLELGEYADAQQYYRKSKELDPYNAIAERNLKRLEVLTAAGSRPVVESNGQRVQPQAFIEETGKAGVTHLLSLGPKETIARVVAGDKLNLRPTGAGLAVDSQGGQYLGIIEPRMALRLLKLTKGGNRYSVNVISSTEDKVSIIIREIHQDPSQIGQISFPPRPTASTVRKPEYEAQTEEPEPPAEGEEVEVVSEESTDDENFDDDDDDEEELEV